LMQLDRLTRREFITLLGSGASAAAWPLAARAQQMPVLGYFSSQSSNWDAPRLAALRQSLAEAGYVVGSNLGIEYRWAEGDYHRLAAQAEEFVRRGVVVIVAGSLPAALAAKAATTNIPIVFVMGADPVKLGLVASLNQPGGNLTGLTQFYGALGGKRLELIRELVPAASLIAVLTNPKSELRGSSRRRARGGAGYGAAHRRFPSWRGRGDRARLCQHDATGRQRIAARRRSLFQHAP
jgi:putative tryptophan/tyrosine transport system substrate-binding protein